MDVTTRDFRFLLREDHGCSIIKSEEIPDFIKFLQESETKENVEIQDSPAQTNEEKK
jgi:hypothetical protein